MIYVCGRCAREIWLEKDSKNSGMSRLHSGLSWPNNAKGGYGILSAGQTLPYDDLLFVFLSGA